MDTKEMMRADWDRRAREDVHYYVAFAKRGQSEDEFLATANLNWPAIESELHRFETRSLGELRALEIGCGPGRLLLRASAVFGEVHGIDISEEMVRIAKARLATRTNIHVHLGNGEDLAELAANSFDFVYSFAVFQHIPGKPIVLQYLAETVRVLKPGGIARLQLRGVDAGMNEKISQAPTWTGCHFEETEVIEFCDSHQVELVAASGQTTQYFWITLRKPCAGPTGPTMPRLNAVTGADTVKAETFTRGERSGITLWLAGFPEGCSLTDFWVTLGERRVRGCWLGTYQRGCYQLNMFVPRGIPPGVFPISLFYKDHPVEGTYEVAILDPPERLRITELSDGIDRLTRQIRSGAIRVCVEGVRDWQKCVFTVGPHRVIVHEAMLVDEPRDAYEFSLAVPIELGSGCYRIAVSNSSAEADTAEFEVPDGTNSGQ